MIVTDETEISAMRKVGQVVARTLAEMQAQLRPGMTTADLDAIGAAWLAKQGARSAPILFYNFPGSTCISINNEAAHGIPSRQRVIRAGDLVNIDVSAELDGYVCDTGATFGVAEIADKQQKLCTYAQLALQRGVAAISAGKPMNALGLAVESVARAGGFTVLRNLTGHGVGRHLHDDPSAVQNFVNRRDKRKFAAGMVLAIEPFLSTGALESKTASDGWTELVPPKLLVAQFEHTIIVTDKQPIILTALD
jgi:methionyl aminopeptidase